MSNPHPVPYSRSTFSCFWSDDKEMAKWREYRANARDRHLVFDLSREKFRDLIRSECWYCGRTPAMGVDRVDSALGYLSGNCVPACRICNLGKREHSLDEFLEMCRQVAYRHPSL